METTAPREVVIAIAEAFHVQCPRVSATLDILLAWGIPEDELVEKTEAWALIQTDGEILASSACVYIHARANNLI